MICAAPSEEQEKQRGCYRQYVPVSFFEETEKEKLHKMVAVNLDYSKKRNLSKNGMLLVILAPYGK